MPKSCKPCCCHVKELQVSISRETSSHPGTQKPGMALRVCTLLAVLIVTTHHIEARASQRGPPVMYPMDHELTDAIYEQPDQRASQEMATLMYQMLQNGAQQERQHQLQQLQQLQQQQQQQEHQEDGDLDSNPMAPEDFPIVSEPLAPADKRGSYMSLCHFKICNMGRKRNLRKTPWGRF